MRKKTICFILLVAVMIISGCGNQRNAPNLSSEEMEVTQVQLENKAETVTSMKEEQQENNESIINIPQTGMTQLVPDSYKVAASRQGSVERLDYDSLDYVRDSEPIEKTAYVYLPYGYNADDTEQKYDIVYLMHGMGGHAGEYFDFKDTKNVFDNLIENGDIPPVIIVSATFYTEKSATDFSGSIRELSEFHQDFENYLMAAVEGKYHTYAEDTTPEGLADSRDHRIFGGFSLGSVTTWLEFCYDYDYIRYFLPMSGSCWYYGTYGDFQTVNNVDFIEQLVEEQDLEKRGYFIYATTGTQDMVKNQTVMQMEEMISRSDVFTADHVVFYQKDGGYHDFDAVQEYLYNALPIFFGGVNE